MANCVLYGPPQSFYKKWFIVHTVGTQFTAVFVEIYVWHLKRFPCELISESSILSWRITNHNFSKFKISSLFIHLSTQSSNPNQPTIQKFTKQYIALKLKFKPSTQNKTKSKKKLISRRFHNDHFTAHHLEF
jgi:hypothetical protein